MTYNAPGKAHRKGITLLELSELFPDDASARQWFEGILWATGDRPCPRCGSLDTHEASHKKMPYRCRDCRKYFSVKTGTVMEGSPIPFRKWVYAIYLDVTSLKGVSSMKLHREIGVTQKTAWFMQQRIREAFGNHGGTFAGPVEVDEAFFGGLEKNKHESQRKHSPGGLSDKAAVIGVKDRATGQVRARAILSTDGETLRGFVREHTEAGAQVYSDGHAAYQPLEGEYKHAAVQHSAGTYVIEQAHTNGIESFWAMLKRGYTGTFHHFSEKHLQRYVNEFAGRHNIRDLDTITQMAILSRGMVGKRLPYAELVA